MKSTQYTEKTLEHFRNPRNVGTLEGPNVAVGRVGNPVCGDMMDIYIDVEDDRIKDIKFQTFGCGSAVATSSMITELVVGMQLDEALKVSRGDVADALDGLPPIKMHCSNLAADALHEAIKNWRAGIKPEDATTTPVEKSCHPRPAEVVEVEIAGLDEYDDKGLYRSVDEPGELADTRVVVLDTGDRAAQLAMDLTDHTGRVVLMTTGKEPSVSLS
ncbi:MAG: iron-sulfur cluster assembly scaffold protein, partial [Thermoleophilia bacterium]|nr:iron-sulfur cluster assembly scaffold protein [Thermoleophilia bacterium]